MTRSTGRSALSLTLAAIVALFALTFIGPCAVSVAHAHGPAVEAAAPPCHPDSTPAPCVVLCQAVLPASGELSRPVTYVALVFDHRQPMLTGVSAPPDSPPPRSFVASA